MKLIITLAAAMFLTACQTSPKDATFANGTITGITGAEALTLGKAALRKDRVEDVQKNAKPIFVLEANEGETIMFTGVKRLEVNVPMDVNVLLAETPDSVSEEVQMAGKVVEGIRAVTPLALGGIALADRNNARRSDAAQAEVNANAQVQMETLRSSERQSYRQDPIILTLPEGGSAGFLGR